MRCKPGDLAIVINATTQKQFIGRVVKVIELYGNDSWICEPDLIGSDGIPRAMFDDNLQPIRPPKCQEETMTWAGKPQEVTA